MTTQNSIQHFIDPVCHMKVAGDSKVQPLEFGSDIYHFCAESCRKAFMADPEKYLKSKPAKRKGLWGRYLERLNKATGGKPPSCCQ
jgi:YHS domain-containing protein